MNQFGLAQPVRRVEDPRLLRGNGCYTDDNTLPGTVHGVVLRSPHEAANLRAIDTEAARAMPGVLAVYTGADLKADGIGGARSLYSQGQAILATAATVIEKGGKAASEVLEAAPERVWKALATAKAA